MLVSSVTSLRFFGVHQEGGDKKVQSRVHLRTLSWPENEQMGVPMEERKGHAAAFDQVMSERRKNGGQCQGSL